MTILQKIKTTLYITFVQPFKDLYIDYLNWYSKHIERRQTYLAKKDVEKAKRKADRLHAETGKRYYVIPYKNGEPLVVSTDNLNALKKKKLLSKSVDFVFLAKEAIYMTKSSI